MGNTEQPAFLVGEESSCGQVVMRPAVLGQGIEGDLLSACPISPNSIYFTFLGEELGT